MKKIKLVLIGAIMVFEIGANAQTEKPAKEPTLGGMFMNYADYKDNKLTYEIDCAQERFKIKLHDFFSKSYVDVTSNGKKYTLQKKDVYGFKDCIGNVYRFFGNEEYHLAETGNITIYSIQRSVPEGKVMKNVNVYFFSAKEDGMIQELTIANLKLAFPTNHKFHDMLDETFKNVEEVSQYDSFHKMYKVNHLYQMSSL